MEYKQDTFDEIIESERQMLLDAPRAYGKAYQNTMGFIALLQDSPKTVEMKYFIFAAFLGQIRKHTTLAFFSTLRRHHVQAMMDLRQVLEASVLAAYSIEFPEVESTAHLSSDGTLKAKKPNYKWLEENYPKSSSSIKAMKEALNEMTSHANIIIAHKSFKFTKTRAHTPFFDFEDDYQIQASLWKIANITMGILDLFYGVNKKHNAITFPDDFVTRLKDLEKQNQEIRDEIISSERYKRVVNK